MPRERSNDAVLDLRICELQRMILAEAMLEYNLKHKDEPDTRCIRDEANKLEAALTELDCPLLVYKKDYRIINDLR